MNTRLCAPRRAGQVLLLASAAALLLAGCSPDVLRGRAAGDHSHAVDSAATNAVAGGRGEAAASDEPFPGEQQPWLPLNDGLMPHAVVTSLAFDPTDPNRLYAGTAGPDGLWISGDRGVSGAPAGGALAGQAVYALLSEPGVLAAATTQGVYQSGDGGRAWDRQPGLSGAPVYALARESTGALLAGGEGRVVYRLAPGRAAGWEALAPLPGGAAVLALGVTAGDCLLAGTDGAGLWRSRDGGRNWESVAEIGQTFVAALRVIAADGRTLFARTRRGLFVSIDAGESWRLAAAGLPGRIDAIAPGTASGEVLIGTSEGEIYSLGMGGDRAVRLAGLGRAGTFGALAVAPDRPSTWYAGTSNGLYISDDAGANWRTAPSGPGRPEAGALAVGPDAAVYLGNGDGLFRLAAVGERWEAWGEGLPADRVQALAFGPTGSGVAYTGLAGQGLYRSQDGGRHWAATGWTGHGVPALLVDPADPGHLFIRAAYERIYESRDAGERWIPRWNGLDLSTQVISLAGDPRQPGVLYAGADDGLFISDDGGSSWQSAGPDLAGQTVFTIAFDPDERGRLYAGATAGAYRSLDGGRTWARWGRGLDDLTVTAFAFDPRSGSAYAGTKYRGVFVSRDGGENWLEAGLPAVTVNSLLLSSDGVWMLAATDAGVFAQSLEAR